MSILVTGFGPFLGYQNNPSARLAEACGRRFEVIEVSYRGVDAFLDGLDPHGFNALLSIGMATKSDAMLLETVGRNTVSATPDVLGEVHGPGVIDPAGPPAIATTLWCGPELVGDDLQTSVNAGGYLCNYMLYRALRRFPDKRVGFLHVPAFTVIPYERQLVRLRSLLESVS